LGGESKRAVSRSRHFVTLCNRMRSGFTNTVNVIEGMKVSIHAVFTAMASGQLRFTGL
jgi:hypothetical protein